MNKFKKIISLVITLMMVLPSFHINVMADETIIEQVEEDNDLFLDDEIQLDDPAEEINDDLPVEGTQDDDPPEEDVIDELPVEESQEDEINDGPILESSTDEQLDEPAEEINDEQADEENAEEEHKDDVQDVQIEEEQLQQFVSLAVMANYDELTPALEPQTDPDKLPPGTVAAEKTARWVDYSNRIAEINLSVEGMPIIFGSDVILVMDVSLSMDTNNRFNTAKNASIQFINGLLGDGNPLNNRVAFIPFHGSRNGGTGNSEVNSVTEGRVNFTYDIDLLTSQVNATSLGLYTNYSAALQKAIQYSNSRPVSERTRPLYIVFMSDGEPNPSSNNGVSQAITLKASPHNATIYTVGIQLTGNAPQALRNLASSVGGEELYKNVSNMNDLAPVLETIAGEIKVAGRNAFFKDYLSEYFDLYNAAPYIGHGVYSTSDRSVTINIGNILEEVKEYKIYVQLKEEYRLDDKNYDTNIDIHLNYIDVNDEEAHRDKNTIGHPAVSVGYGTITVKYVLVNSDGNYIDRESGVEVEHGFRNFVPEQSYHHLFEHNGSTKLEVEEDYTVGAIVPAGYSLYSGESATKNITLTSEERNPAIEFKVVASPKPIFTVSYDANGGSGTMSEDKFNESDTVIVPENEFVRDGYTFEGWNTEANGSGRAYQPGEIFNMPAEDVTLYAQWTIINEPEDPGDEDPGGEDPGSEDPGNEDPGSEDPGDEDPGSEDPGGGSPGGGSSGGGSPGGGSGGGTTIEDLEVPLADLERVDHFAYIIGYPEGDVRPLNNITREEVAMIFYRLLTDESREEFFSDENPFTDMDENHQWSNLAVSTLYKAGIIVGYPDGTFRPTAPITRAEFATIAAKFDDLDLGSPSKFTDIAGHWAEEYITSSEIKGWIKGYPDLTFKPEQDITRAEAVTLINNVLERLVHPDNIHPDAMFWPDVPRDAWYFAAVMEATNSHDYIHEDEEIWTGMKPNKLWP